MIKSKYNFKYVNALAIPAVITGVIDPLISLTDAAVVGNIQSKSVFSLAAIGIAGSFIATLGWVFTQSKVAVAALVSEYLGKKQLSAIHKLPGQMLWLNILLGIVIAAVTTMLAPSIFKLYHAQGEVLTKTVQYYRIRAIGFPFLFFVITVFAVFRGLQNTFWPMVITLFGAVINLVLDYVLVYGIENVIKPWGFLGAAWASVVAQVLMFILSIFLLHQKTSFSLKVNLRLHKKFRSIFSVSIHMLVRTIALNVSLLMSSIYASKYGANTIAAFTIAFQLWLFFAYFIDGYAGVAGIVAGKLKGEGNFSELKGMVKLIANYAFWVSILLSLIFGVNYFYIAEFFTKDVEVIKMFNSFFWLVLLMQPINALAFLMDDVFKGLAGAKTLRNTLLKATFFGFIPVLLLLDYCQFKIFSVWIAILVWMLCRATILMFKFVRVIKTGQVT